MGGLELASNCGLGGLSAPSPRTGSEPRLGHWIGPPLPPMFEFRPRLPARRRRKTSARFFCCKPAARHDLFVFSCGACSSCHLGAARAAPPRKSAVFRGPHPTRGSLRLPTSTLHALLTSRCDGVCVCYLHALLGKSLDLASLATVCRDHVQAGQPPMTTQR